MKQIRLEHFRCYTDLSIDFKSGINLLIGDNASGKTTVLKACQYVLSSFFAGYSDENTRWISPGDDDFTVQISNGNIQPEQPVKIYFVPDSNQYAAVAMTDGNFIPGQRKEEYIIQKNSKKNSRALISGIEMYRNYAKTILSTNGALPVWCSFSTEDIHANRSINASKFKEYAQKASFGYYECLNGDGFFRYWLKRLLILQEGQKNLHEIETVRTALANALGTNNKGCGIIQNMHIRHNQGKVYYVFSDGREVDADHLSDGYRRLVNIVTDIAFRCALLNGRLYGAKSALLTKGTVLIDEIDMHLHPTLQARVLQGLHNAFPMIQFIVTTHAPMVMTSIENNADNIVYQLNYDNGNYHIQERETYGMDASTITDVILNQTPRAQEVDNQLGKLFDLIDSGSEEASTLLRDMQARFGDKLPELAEAEAMLDFSIEEDNEEN